MKENQFGRQRKPSRAQKSVINNRFVYGTFTQSKIGVKDKPLRHNIISFFPLTIPYIVLQACPHRLQYLSRLLLSSLKDHRFILFSGDTLFSSLISKSDFSFK